MRNYKYRANENIKDNKRDLILLEQTTKKQKQSNIKAYRYSCNKCNHKDIITENSLKNGCGCSVCVGRKIVKDINSLWKTDNELVEIYFVNIEDSYAVSRGSGKKVLLKCPECSEERLMSVNKFITKGFNCPRCSDGVSYPNKFMYSLLKQLDVKFETEYSPKWIGRKRYDFYIQNLNVIIEMDGGFHQKDNYMSGQSLGESRQVDRYKDSKAKEKTYR